MAWIWSFAQKNIPLGEFGKQEKQKRGRLYKQTTSKFNEKKINLYLLARKRKIQQARI